MNIGLLGINISSFCIYIDTRGNNFAEKIRRGNNRSYMEREKTRLHNTIIIVKEKIIAYAKYIS